MQKKRNSADIKSNSYLWILFANISEFLQHSFRINNVNILQDTFTVYVYEVLNYFFLKTEEILMIFVVWYAEMKIVHNLMWLYSIPLIYERCSTQ